MDFVVSDMKFGLLYYKAMEWKVQGMGFAVSLLGVLPLDWG